MDSRTSARGDFVRELYDGSYRRLVGQLLAITGDRAEAEDAVQEAFVRAINHARALQHADNPEAWLRRVAINVVRSRWRRAKTFAKLVPRLPQPAPAGEPSADRVVLAEAMRSLPASQREAIALHHIAGLPVHEVAATLGVPAGTVKARLSRGRAALAEVLSDEESLEVRHD
ncbi:MAG TPA: SigE family RNA polymerase sigma factor [Nocardioidaceae bacterium]|nr:SigE family RNA polymerase sigma factor [Nocardioidaceae bacterium]